MTQAKIASLLPAIAYWLDRYALATSDEGLITGLTYTDVNGTVVLRDFTLLAAGKGSLSLTNCSNFGMQNLTKLPEGIVITGSKVVIRDCAFTGNLTINGASDVEMVDSSCINLSITGSSSFHAVGSSF